MTRLISLCYCVMLVSICAADEVRVPVAESTSIQPMFNDDSVRKSVERSLPFLENEGVAWMQDRGCMSCHHVPFLIWTHRAAQSKEFNVDVEKLTSWEAWSIKDSLEQRNLYRLQDYELSKVDDSALPVSVKAKLKPLLDAPFKSLEEFRTALMTLLTVDELQSHEVVIIKVAERSINAPDRTGGGLDVLGQLLLSGKGSASEIQQPAFRDGIVSLMRQLQQTDGYWVPGNQFLTMRQWSQPVANQSTTMWAAISLAAVETHEQLRQETLQKAQTWQELQHPAQDNHEWLATHALFQHYYGTEEHLEKSRQSLLAVQNSDGGWGWQSEVDSDPYTTGLALYVLAKVCHAEADNEVEAARNYLLNLQQPDGSWHTQSKNISNTTDLERLKARDEIYHYWGTAWAALGLLESLDTPSGSR